MTKSEILIDAARQMNVPVIDIKIPAFELDDIMGQRHIEDEARIERLADEYYYQRGLEM